MRAVSIVVLNVITHFYLVVGRSENFARTLLLIDGSLYTLSNKY